MSTVDAQPKAVQWTDEQRVAIESRTGNLLLAAGAGSGKTSVLVERFARAVLEDGVEVGAILAITFTDKAAAELRERIRTRLREAGADEAARATEGAFISTIHGFCARVLRTHALAAGIDPRFTVADQPESQRLSDAAFDEALEQTAREDQDAIELLAAYNAGALRGAVLGAYGELRSRGHTEPALPPLPPAPDLEAARTVLRSAAAEAARELGALSEPGARVLLALERVGRCADALGAREPASAELEDLKLPGGNGAALSTPVCLAYRDALEAFRAACEHRAAIRVHGLLSELISRFGVAYARRKRERSLLDFADLELMTRDLLAADGALRERYRGRFAQVMVDELQDTNRVQLDLIEHVSERNLFTVGDAQQSIYAFRHADVELFEHLAQERERAGERTTLQINFRSRGEILEVINQAFRPVFGDRFLALQCGRGDPPAGEPRVELLVADKGAQVDIEGLASPWRVAEARALARRVEELIEAGAAPREVVVLSRATTDLRVYERSLEELGIPTYVIGGRGYWAHPQVIDLVSYLRALANPRDETHLYTVLASPLVDVSLDALVVLAAAARSAGRDPWWVLREPEGAFEGLPAGELERLQTFAEWFAAERSAAPRLGIDELIDRALVGTGYDLAMLAMPGGQRRLANVRKLMRLGREFEAANGPDLRGFLDLVRGREQGWGGYGDPRESEAPVEGEALEAVRLMTIHRAKGLEFEIVCVADLGRGPRFGGEMLRLGRDGRLGLRLSEPGTARAVPALHYRELGDEAAARAEQEERRLFYVAMTRARERLILSGAAKLDALEQERSPMGWIYPAVVEAGVQAEVAEALSEDRAEEPGEATSVPVPEAADMDLATPAPASVQSLSYSGLEEYGRCAYRFYVQRVLGVPPMPERGYARSGSGSGGHGRLDARERGILVHALLEGLDFRRPVPPTASEVMEAAPRRPSYAEAEQIAALITLFAGSEVCARLAAAGEVRREERFAFLLGGVLVGGALDVLARETDGGALIVDYKSDRLEGQDPGALVGGHYATQRLIYALAALRSGSPRVEVAHVFLEAPRDPVSASYSGSDAPRLEAELEALAAGVQARDWRVTEEPHRGICEGCPAEGGLCSWPLAVTRREAPDRLF